ncbi:cysteine dioxygenase family protein [Kitasatospora kifunensis]|uniref:Putative metal-dependent enzyme (Double-stranded beta helix superfamily) n=1 Tax=Kitasatospora kifunensis TaxID=58351 RepID=A0A7W7QXZ9_KITKI|nr:cysteine dioxygenase family protein [Kitasatospora kifunensis]MBB4921858.1 putative metal-dependent enzyme (double-stranded beta helix superfamily) [Kitasatospora kifunensis]
MTATTMARTAGARITPLAEALVARTRAIVSRALTPAQTAELAAEQLRGFLGNPELLTPEQQVGDPDCYRQHVLHAESDGSFSVVALVWLPGQQTAIHDHVSWCVAGVHQGQESERRYRLVPEGIGAARLVATEDVVNPLGSVCGFAPPGDIHLVRNSCSGTAISIHLYGADVLRLGSSVRRLYSPPEGE